MTYLDRDTCDYCGTVLITFRIWSIQKHSNLFLLVKTANGGDVNDFIIRRNQNLTQTKGGDNGKSKSMGHGPRRKGR